MDGESFDRLSVVVHRLRDQATRRGALRLLFGGTFAAAAGLAADDATANHKHKNKNKHKHNNNNRRWDGCHNYGGRCFSHNDCCNGNCRNGFCWYGGGGGGGNQNCGGQYCSSGWDCDWIGGVPVCVPNDFSNCCGGNCYGSGYHCCDNNGYGGGNYGGGACYGGFDGCTGQFNVCCQPGWKYCNSNGRCCPSGWYCGDIACHAYQADGVTIEESETVPFSDPITVDEKDWIPRNQG
jgi:hypothetical protein